MCAPSCPAARRGAVRLDFRRARPGVGLPGWAVVLSSSLIFGGSSQVVFAQLWGRRRRRR